jgi:hypothetical protein
MQKVLKKSVFLYLLFLINYVHAFENPAKPGISNDDNIGPVLEYQLPSWNRYSVPLIFDLNSSKQYSEVSDVNDFTKSNIIFNIVPGFHYFKKNKDYYNQTHIEDNTEYISKLNFSYSVNKYIYNSVFIFFNPALGHENQYWKWERDQNNNNINDKGIYLETKPELEIGIGFGRIRNVTPIIRALRFKDRYESLNPDKTINNEEVQKVAQFISQRNQYNAFYSRPEKYFWRDFSNIIPDKLNTITIDDAFYLAESLSDNMPIRNEG